MLLISLYRIPIYADLRAAREKNGVYIPHERFAQDEAEKKACIKPLIFTFLPNLFHYQVLLTTILFIYMMLY